MNRLSSWLFDSKHPVRGAAFFLLLAVGSGYEALYIRPNNPLSVFDWIFSIGGAIAFIFYVLNALSDYFYGTDE